MVQLRGKLYRGIAMRALQFIMLIILCNTPHLASKTTAPSTKNRITWRTNHAPVIDQKYKRHGSFRIFYNFGERTRP